MHTNFYNHITKYFDLIDNKKILILNDPYYLFNPTKININIEKKIKSQIPPIITIVQNNFGFWKHQPTIRLNIHLCPLTKIRLKQIKLNLN